MILGVTYNHNFSPASFDFVTLRNALDCIVSALGMKIRPDFADNGAHILFRKDHHSVNILQRRQNLSPFRGRHRRSAFTFQSAHRGIPVNRDNQLVGKLPSPMQVAYMADMKHVEAAVGERDAISPAPPICHAVP